MDMNLSLIKRDFSDVQEYNPVIRLFCLNRVITDKYRIVLTYSTI